VTHLLVLSHSTRAVCPPVETEFSRRLRERVEAARRCLAESDVSDRGVRNAGERKREDIAGLSVEQILYRGRMRAQLATE